MQLAEFHEKSNFFREKILLFTNKLLFYPWKFLMVYFLIINSDFQMFSSIFKCSPFLAKKLKIIPYFWQITTVKMYFSVKY